MINSRVHQEYDFETLEFMEVRNAGDLESECLVIQVMRDCDLHSFLLGSIANFEESDVPDLIDTAIWLPHVSPREFDKVLLWTRGGVNAEKSSTIDVTHHVFLGRSESLWDKATPFLFEIRRYLGVVARGDGYPKSVVVGGFDERHAEDCHDRSASGGERIAQITTGLHQEEVVEHA